MKIAIVRGAFLNQYEGQMFFPLVRKHSLTAFCSSNPIHSELPFEVLKLPCPLDINFGPFSRLKMPILNRIFIDAHWLIGLEYKLKGYDIAHCSDTYYNFTHQCVVAKRRGYVKRIVATIYENIPFNNESIWGRKRFKRDAMNNVDYFIAVSKRSKETLLLEGLDERKVAVIPPGIDINRFKPKSRRWVEKSGLNILFVGRLEFYKGIYEVVYAAKRLLSDSRLSTFNLNFSMIGNGTQKEKILRLIRRLGLQQHFTVKEVPYNIIHKEYERADIFIAPSRATPTYQEQFGTVLMEAQAAGLPIVTTFSGSIPENVQEAALLANPGDFYSISELIKKFILHPELRKEYGTKAFLHARKFDSEIISRKIEEVYLSLL